MTTAANQQRSGDGSIARSEQRIAEEIEQQRRQVAREREEAKTAARSAR